MGAAVCSTSTQWGWQCRRWPQHCVTVSSGGSDVCLLPGDVHGTQMYVSSSDMYWGCVCKLQESLVSTKPRAVLCCMCYTLAVEASVVRAADDDLLADVPMEQRLDGGRAAPLLATGKMQQQLLRHGRPTGHRVLDKRDLRRLVTLLSSSEVAVAPAYESVWAVQVGPACLS